MNYYNYFSEIEETFIRRRGRNLLLSPLDWALIEDWQNRGVPLRIVLSGIGKIFDSLDKQPAKKQTVKSLTYCREEIEAQYANWLTTQIGKNGSAAAQSSNSIIQSSEPEVQNPKSPDTNSSFDEATTAHLERVALGLTESLPKTDGELRALLGKLSQDLAKLKQNPSSSENLEKTLEEMDAQIDEILLKTEATEKLKTEIEKQIASYKNKMEREVYRRTFDLMLLKRLREQMKIPRFGLFNL